MFVEMLIKVLDAACSRPFKLVKQFNYLCYRLLFPLTQILEIYDLALKGPCNLDLHCFVRVNISEDNIV